MTLGSPTMAIGSVLMGFGSILMGAGSVLTGKGSTLMGNGSALTVGADSTGVVASIGSLVDFGVVTTGSSLMGLEMTGIGFSIGLTGFPVGSGVGVGLIINRIDGGLTIGVSRS